MGGMDTKLTIPDDVGDRARGSLLGLAAGDAVGTTVEFSWRGTFPEVTDMVGGGPFGLQPGEWTDDTSMALCLATSLLESDGFDARDQMDRYLRWRDAGYLSSNGHCFDIGSTVNDALRRYETTGEPLSGSTDRHAAGNGSIMRLAPVPLFYWPDEAATVAYSGASSPTTHGAAECVDACRYLGLVLWRALGGASREAMLAPPPAGLVEEPAIRAIAAGGYQDKTEREIRGTGYVVDSLEAALWCFATTNSFENAVLRATNLGDDADTTAAVCGQVAGAFYGEAGIPAPWLARLVMAGEIRQLADDLLAARPFTD